MPIDIQTLPNLLIPGAARSGTTALYRILSTHPQIYMSPYKEPHVLSNPAKGVEDYEKLFAGAEGYLYRGEASTSYLTAPGVIDRIRRLLPDPRIIVMLRNPVDRAWSHYWFVRGQFAAEPLDFRQAFARNIDESPEFEVHDKNYYQTGVYSKWLTLFMDAFDRDRLLAIVFEDFIEDPPKAMREIYDFLDVQYVDPPVSERVNEGGVLRHPTLVRGYVDAVHFGGRTIMRLVPSRAYRALSALNRRVFRSLLSAMDRELPPPMLSEDRAWVAAHYRQDVAKLREMLGRNFPWADFTS